MSAKTRRRRTAANAPYQQTPLTRSSSTSVAEFATNARESSSCKVCGRTLLLGERSLGFFSSDGEGPFEVCVLCVPNAQRVGLRAEPSSPDEVVAARKRKRLRRTGSLTRLSQSFRRSPRPGVQPAGITPAGTAAVPSALARFNASEQARTLAGLYKTLGQPRACVVPRSAADREIVLTVAWEIVWYQFQISPGSITVQRGTYLEDLPVRWQQWNCVVAPDGTVDAPKPEHAIEDPAGMHLMPAETWRGQP